MRDEGAPEPEGFVYRPAICPGLNPGRSFTACDGVGARSGNGDVHCRSCGETFRSRENQVADFLDARGGGRDDG